jgi:hypothetical protein
MKVQGNYVMIEVPVIPKSVIELPDDAKKKWEEEKLKEVMKLIVKGVGPDVTRCKVGNEVFVANRVLRSADLFEHDNNQYWLVPDSQILIVF